MRTGSIIWMCLSLLTGAACATTYEGPMPRLPVEKEEVRRTEFEAFRFDPGELFSAPTLGGRVYDLDSLEPVFEHVDRDAAESFERARLSTTVGGIASTLGLAAIVLGVVTSDGDGPPAAPTTGGILLIGLGAGLDVYGLLELRDAATQYNDTLWKRTAAGPATAPP